jgi:predicted enzyme related to lactoylglutathione lyase
VIERIENVTIPVSDLKRALAFYENVLGSRSETNGPIMQLNIGEMMLGLNPDPKAELQIYMTVADVNDVYKTLKERGVRFINEPKDQY